MDREIKYCAPTRLDNASFGTIWKVIISEKEYVYYIQLSHESTNPQWEKMSYLFEKALERYVTDDNFMAHLLRLFDHQAGDVKTLVKKGE